MNPNHRAPDANLLRGLPYGFRFDLPVGTNADNSRESIAKQRTGVDGSPHPLMVVVHNFIPFS